MKYLKTYEKNINKPKIGDYVICDVNKILIYFDCPDTDFIYFMNNTVGRCIAYCTEYDIKRYLIQFNVPENVNRRYFNYVTSWKKDFYKSPNSKYASKDKSQNCESLELKHFLYWSNNKEDCEEFLTTKKYNI